MSFLDSVDVLIKDEGPFEMVYFKSIRARNWAKSMGKEYKEPLSPTQTQELEKRLKLKGYKTYRL